MHWQLSPSVVTEAAMALGLRVYALFGIVPLLAILAVTTNPLHGLMWTAPGLNVRNPYLPLEPAYGPVYWAYLAYMGALTVHCEGARRHY